MSLYRTPLGAILPAEPTGNVDRGGLRAAASPISAGATR